MPIPPAIVLEPELFVPTYLADKPAHEETVDFFRALGPETKAYVAEGIEYDILTRLIEDGYWSEPLEPQFAGQLCDDVHEFIQRLSNLDILEVVARQSFLKGAFRLATSTNLPLPTCVAASLAIKRRVPLIVSTIRLRAD